MGLAMHPGGVVTLCVRSGKDRLTKNAAKKMAKTMERRGSLKMDAYRCPFCDGWHVGGRRFRG